MPSHEELLAPTKRTRTRDVLRAAINSGKPLPLTVLLESMWQYRDEAIRRESLMPGDDGYDPHAARACRMTAVAIAEKAAVYVHPKLANVTLRPEDDIEAADRRAAQRLSASQLQGKSVTELGSLYLSILKGEEEPHAMDAAPPADEPNQPDRIVLVEPSIDDADSAEEDAR